MLKTPVFAKKMYLCHMEKMKTLHPVPPEGFTPDGPLPPGPPGGAPGAPITVVVPVHNRAHIIGPTLQSIENQTLLPERLVLVENASEDNTLQVLRAFARRHPGWVTVVQCPTPGACHARNAGLEEVHTPWVMFFDSDDIMHPTHIERFDTARRRHPGKEIIGATVGYQTLQGRHRKLYFAHPAMGPMLLQHLFRTSLATQRYMARTALVRQAGGWNTALPVWNDIELGLRLLQALGRRPGRKILALRGAPTVTVIALRQSLTGTRQSDNAQGIEKAFGAMRSALQGNPRGLRWLAGRRAVWAATMWSEGARTQARRTLAQTPGDWRIKLLYHQNRLCRRLTWPLAYLLLAY